LRVGDEVFGDISSSKPVMVRVYSLEEVPEAMRRIGAGDVPGKVVVTI
jgi:hypothetical protein